MADMRERLWVVHVRGSSTWIVRARSEGSAIVKAIQESGILLSHHVDSAEATPIEEMRG
jgi:hypothetical protein